MKYNKIDTNLLPKAWLYWSNNKGSFYVDCHNNEMHRIKPNIIFSWRDKDNILVKSGSSPHFAYAKYHEDIERLELAAVTFDTRRTAESHEWKYAGDRYFIDKEKRVFDVNGNEFDGRFFLYKDHSTYYFKHFLDMYIRFSAHNNIVKEFHKLIGGETFTNSTGKVYKAEYIWYIREWYIRKQKVNNKGKAHKLTDQLTAIPLSDFSNFGKKYPAILDTSCTYRSYIKGIVYFERVNDEWSVLRVFERTTFDDTTVRETERMYLHDDGTNRIATPSENGWIPAKQFCSYEKYQFVNRNEAMEKCNRLKYIIPLFENEVNMKKYLITTLRFPEIEQLIKLGYYDFARKIAGSNTPKADMKQAFGGYYNEKEKNLLRKVGLTKHQLDKHMSKVGSERYYYRRVATTLERMREWFGDDFAHLDNTTFDNFYDAFSVIYNNWGYSFDGYINRIGVDKKKFVKNMVRLGKKHENVYTMITDTVRMYCNLTYGTAPQIDWYFDSYSDAVRIHDAIMEIKRMQDEERQARYNKEAAERKKKEEEKRKKVDEMRKELEYEDDKYIIRLPKDGNEIVAEGARQHICIGGYVSNHSNGYTNLFFIRKKSEPTIPFYAIEMNNSKEVVQIHGFGNKWLGNNPEAIPTVIRWLRKNGIRCKNAILTCTATGYGATANYVPMPVVD